MTNSELIAGFAGPLLVAVAFAILVNRKTFDAVMREAGTSLGFIFFAGLLTLVAGLAIVRSHNIWSADWRVLVTVIGWLSVIGGLARIIVPNRVAAVRERIAGSETAMTAWALVALLLGLYLSAKGYNVVG